MDPIQEMIRDADPLKAASGPEPDAQAALERILADPDGFVDKLPADVPSLEHARRRRTARVVGLLTIAAAAVTAGVLIVANLGSLTSVPEPAGTATPTASPTVSASGPAPATPTPTPSATGTAAAVPTAASWKTFTDMTGQATFEMPADWIAVQRPTMIDGMPFAGVSVRNAANKELAKLVMYYDMAAGPCEVPKPVTVLDAEILDIPQTPYKGPAGPNRFRFAVIQGDKLYGTVAISDEPGPSAQGACELWNMVTGPEGVPGLSFGDVLTLRADSTAPLVFDTVAEARAYMQTQEYQDLKRMLISLSLRPSKTVVSSLYRNEATKMQFELPIGWTAAEVPAGTAAAPETGIVVRNETGRTMARWNYGAAQPPTKVCRPGESYPMAELDTYRPQLTNDWTLNAGARFSYRTVDRTATGQGVAYEIGLVDKSSGTLKDSCTLSSTVSGGPLGTLTFSTGDPLGEVSHQFATMAEAMAYMETTEYAKLKMLFNSMQMSQ